MLSDFTPRATLAVTDLARARSFYTDTLGLSVDQENQEGFTLPCGSAMLFVYRSSYAGTNKATAVSFDLPAEAFDSEVATLRDKGAEFTTFDMEGVTWSDGVATMGQMKAVWFTDPDGNIFSLATGEM